MLYGVFTFTTSQLALDPHRHSERMLPQVVRVKCEKCNAVSYWGQSRHFHASVLSEIRVKTKHTVSDLLGLPFRLSMNVPVSSIKLVGFLTDMKEPIVVVVTDVAADTDLFC